MELIAEEVAVGGLARESIVHQLVVDTAANELYAVRMNLFFTTACNNMIRFEVGVT